MPLLFVIHPPSFALGMVVGAFFAGPLAMWLIASIAIVNRVGDRRK